MPTPTPPNILLVMTDQQRADLTRGTGFPLDTMPTVDALGASGTVFTSGYTASPLCVPARVSLFTGRFPSAHGVKQNSTGQHARFGLDMLDVLRAQGYRLGFSGKPHFHRPLTDFDAARGPFMHTNGPQANEADAAFDAWLDELDHGVATEPTPFDLTQQLPYRIVDGAIEVLDEFGTNNPDDPFFCWLSFPEPHNPYQVPSPYFEMFDEETIPERIAGPEHRDAKGPMFRWLGQLFDDKRPGFDDNWRRYRANYFGMLRLIDDQIARLADHLGDLMDNTVVIFVADHGDFVGEYGLQRKGAGLPEVLTRIPFQISGPGISAGRTLDIPVSLVDIFPTVCELVGAPIPDGVQGRSLAPILRGGEPPAHEFDSMYAELGYGGVPYREHERPALHFPYETEQIDELNTVTMSGGSRMVRSGNFKLIVNVDGETELYDIAVDPVELTNLANDPAHATERDRLLVLLTRWMIRVGDDLPRGVYTPKIAPHNWRWAPEQSEAS